MSMDSTADANQGSSIALVGTKSAPPSDVSPSDSKQPPELEYQTNDGELKRVHMIEEEEPEETSTNPAHIHRRLMFAAKKGNLQTLRDLVKQGGDVKAHEVYNPPEKDVEKGGFCSWLFGGADEEEEISAPAIADDYPLHVAAAEGHLEMIEAIVDLGADLEAKNRIGATALHKAVSCNQLASAEKLIELGASIDTTNNIGNTALHIAVFCQHKDIINLLLANGAYAQLHSPNKIAYTPLSYAKGSQKITALLKEFKPSAGSAARASSPESKEAAPAEDTEPTADPAGAPDNTEQAS
eukprot:gb/GEZN01011730.1/.p1 GENE.gb/GEZN01011730.1/~~gb/GEZN01011730.1/.p1  ORF type:complete len:297 (-),score=46.32 gb/GEZN01011730.1/:92-982(-)